MQAGTSACRHQHGICNSACKRQHAAGHASGSVQAAACQVCIGLAHHQRARGHHTQASGRTSQPSAPSASRTTTMNKGIMNGLQRDVPINCNESSKPIKVRSTRHVRPGHRVAAPRSAASRARWQAAAPSGRGRQGGAEEGEMLGDVGFGVWEVRAWRRGLHRRSCCAEDGNGGGGVDEGPRLWLAHTVIGCVCHPPGRPAWRPHYIWVASIRLNTAIHHHLRAHLALAVCCAVLSARVRVPPSPLLAGARCPLCATPTGGLHPEAPHGAGGRLQVRVGVGGGPAAPGKHIGKGAKTCGNSWLCGARAGGRGAGQCCSPHVQCMPAPCRLAQRFAPVYGIVLAATRLPSCWQGRCTLSLYVSAAPQAWGARTLHGMHVVCIALHLGRSSPPAPHST